MKVFMLGWEFPPFISGGLGTACYGLTKAMSKMGTDVIFALPKPVVCSESTHVKMLTPRDLSGCTINLMEESEHFRNVELREIKSMLFPYDTEEAYEQRLNKIIKERHSKVTTQYIKTAEDEELSSGHYSGDMFTEIHRYATAASHLAVKEDFDVIHAHDWMTYPAAVAVASATGKPLVVHVHSTEFDRSGVHVNQQIYDIERMGMHHANKIIAVSHLTRNIIISRYGITGDKVEVVYNGVERNGSLKLNYPKIGIRSDEKIVLFLGRITMQKGPEYFLMAAKKVLEVIDNVKFVMAGSGDMMQRVIEMAADLGIGHKVLFTGFLRGKDVERVYQMADLYVMPSVSEPFGIAPLEALNHDIPVLISKQSGVSEVLTHVLKTDFWDTTEIANKITAVLKYAPLQMTLREHGNFEVRKLRWEDAARKCLDVYNSVTPDYCYA